MNLKSFQAGKRARCPACSGRFRVPDQSCDFSFAVEEESESFSAGASATKSAERFELQQPTSISRSENSGFRELSHDGRERSGSRGSNASQPGSQPVSQAGGQTVQAAGQMSGLIPRAISDAPQAVWYVRPPSGGQYGPADAAVCLQWIQENRIGRDAYVWRDGWPQWKLASEAFDELYTSPWIDSDNGDTSPEPQYPEVVSAEESAEGTLRDTALRDTAALPEPTPSRLRRRPRQSHHGLLIGILAVLALALVGVLVAVMM